MFVSVKLLGIGCWLVWYNVCSLYKTFLFWPDCEPEGPLFSAEFVCVCVSVTGTSTLLRWPIVMKLGHKDPTLI